MPFEGDADEHRSGLWPQADSRRQTRHGTCQRPQTRAGREAAFGGGHGGEQAEQECRQADGGQVHLVGAERNA